MGACGLRDESRVMRVVRATPLARGSLYFLWLSCTLVFSNGMSVLSSVESLAGSFTQQHWAMVAIVATTASLVAVLLHRRARTEHKVDIVSDNATHTL